MLPAHTGARRTAIWEVGEVVAYRCEDCLDRWDVVLTDDDDPDHVRPV